MQAAEKETTVIQDVDPFAVLERMRTFAHDPEFRRVTERVYRMLIGDKPFIVASNGWVMVAIPGGLVDDVALNGLNEIPEEVSKAFVDYFGSDFEHDRFSTKLKKLRLWCGAAEFRHCEKCSQSINVGQRPGYVMGKRLIDRNLIAMAIEFGDPDGKIDIGATDASNIAPVVFRHAHFLAVIMPMRETTGDNPPRFRP